MATYTLPEAAVASCQPNMIRPAPLGYRVNGSPVSGRNPHAIRLDMTVSIDLDHEFKVEDLDRMIAFLADGTNQLLIPAQRFGFEAPANAADANLHDAVAVNATSCTLTGNIPAARIGRWISIRGEIKLVQSVASGTNTTVVFEPMMHQTHSSGGVVRIANPRGSYVPRADLSWTLDRKTQGKLMLGGTTLDLVESPVI